MRQTSSAALLVLVLSTGMIFAGTIQVHDPQDSKGRIMETNLSWASTQVETTTVTTQLSLFVVYIASWSNLVFAANLTDINMNPIAGETIAFSFRRYPAHITEGWIPLGTAATNAAGEAVLSLGLVGFTGSYSLRARHEQHLNFSACERRVIIVLPSGQAIHIRSDGSIDPPDAPIQRNGDSYFLTDDVTADSAGIAVERDNVTLDGMGHFIQPHPYVLGQYGIGLAGRTNVTIQNVRIGSFTFDIDLLTSTGSTVTRNSFIGFEYPAILLTHLVILETGIRLSDSTNNIISENEVTNCYTGAYFESSSNNKIYHNKFIRTYNKPVVNYYDSVNIWNDDYPSGGNFWNDYGGLDLLSGPFQNETGRDGLGDTPYVIDENNQDKYPLMNQWQDITSPDTFDNYDGLWHTTDFTVTLTATDDKSGAKATYHKVNDGPTKTVSTDGQPLINTEGAENKLEYWSVDNAGNKETPHILTGIKLDKTAPMGSILINNGDAYTNSTSVTLDLTSTDDTSGVHETRYSNDGVWDTEPWETFSLTKTWSLMSGDGTKTVYYQVKDNAGLTSSCGDSIVLDTKPIADAGVDQTVNENTLVTFNGSASTDENGIATYTWEFGDGATGAGRTATHAYTTAGTYNVTLTIKDYAGNSAFDSLIVTVRSEKGPSSSAEAVPIWMAVAIIAIIGIAVGATLLLRRRK